MTFEATFNLATLDGSNGFIIRGVALGDGLGAAISGAGDINGDGIADFILGAPSGGDGILAGESYVIFGGGSLGSTGSFDLNTLDGSNGFAIGAVANLDLAGTAVSAAGDVNGDSLDDLIVGSPNADPLGRNFAGASYVILGQQQGFASRLELDALDGSNGFTLVGPTNNDATGTAVSHLGDINADGLDDLIIGAPEAAQGRGEGYVVFGAPNLGSSGSVDLADLNGNNGFVINGVGGLNVTGQPDRARTGAAVSNIGDFNGDGVNDLLIAAPRDDVDGVANAGEIYVVFGGSDLGSSGTLDLADLNGSNGFAIAGASVGSGFGGAGRAISDAGDFNGDGFADLLIGEQNADIDGDNNVGKAYVIFGGTTVGSSGHLSLGDLEGSKGFELRGFGAFDGWGRSVSSAGDLNQDGFADIIVGSNNGEGSFLIYGDANFGSTGSLDLAAIAGINGTFILNEDTPAAITFTGRTVSEVGDINDSGINDVVTGNPPGNIVYVVFGEALVDDVQPPVMPPTDECVLPDGSDDLSPVVSDDDNALKGTQADDVIAGELGNDVILGCEGDDVLRGDRNSRSEQAGEPGGDDYIDGGAGNDRIGGKSGNDTLLGGAGDDRIWGDAGDDILNGEAGDDILFGDSGRTVGADTFILTVGEGIDTIGDYNKGGVIDTIQVLGSTAFTTSQHGEDTLIMVGTETLGILTGFTGDVTFA
ncbi:MAG: hypothetical protein AAGH78_00230 [Cyanobacteria bacterium P01_H01_bin.58]